MGQCCSLMSPGSHKSHWRLQQAMRSPHAVEVQGSHASALPFSVATCRAKLSSGPCAPAECESSSHLLILPSQSDDWNLLHPTLILSQANSHSDSASSCRTQEIHACCRQDRAHADEHMLAMTPLTCWPLCQYKAASAALMSALPGARLQAAKMLCSLRADQHPECSTSMAEGHRCGAAQQCAASTSIAEK